MSDIKTLEHSTLKVPYELLNKQFRSSQKVIDREVSKVNTSAGELENKMKSESITVGDVTSALTSMVDNLSMLKRKAEESIQDEIDASRVIKRRLAHLQERNQTSLPDGPPPLTWQKHRLDRMLVEYFLRAGYYTTALRLAKHSGIEDLTNIQLFMMSKEIEDSLQRSETKSCLAWCADNRSKLRKLKSTLEFNIRKQEYIELIRENKRLEAIKHARKHLSPSTDPSQVADVQKLMGMLAFDCNKAENPYADLFSHERWDALVLQFRSDNFQLHQLNSTSVFTATLQAGLSALKTPHCYKDSRGPRGSDCPVCTRHMKELAQPLAFAHCAHSKLVCSISGLPLNENNPPMMMPNGRIYGLKALETMAIDNEGRMVCPRTQEICHLSELEKVFVM